jgi:hypothetical protein
MSQTTHDNESHGKESTAHTVRDYAGAAETIDKLVRRWYHDIEDLLDKKAQVKVTLIKDDLAKLRFEPKEFRRLLEQVASDAFKEKREVVDELGRMLQETAGEVHAILYGLNQEHRKFIDTRYGANFWNRLERQVFVIKNQIREELDALLRTKGTKNIQNASNELLKKIERFNEDLAVFCDTISPPKRKPTT